MMKYIAVLGMVSLTACGGSTTTATTATTPTGAAGATAAANNAAFGTLLNNVRTTNAAANVTFDARLATAAQVHADDMVANNFFSHTGSNGSTVGQRATAAGYNFTQIGENIAQGQADEAAAMTSWTNSAPHHANNINPGFKDFGLAKAGPTGDLRWVLVLGSE